jgi:hypothetical protein
VTIGIGDQVLWLEDARSLGAYHDFLCNQFPENTQDIGAIVQEIRKIMGYMDVLYGVDNPAFLDLKKDRDYFIKVVLPWMFKFIITIRKINKLNEAVELYLRRFTTNQALIDMIAQHFFKATPASFALSYFSLYLDYHYPEGGTATLIRKLESFVLDHGGEIRTSVTIRSLNPEARFVTDEAGNDYQYNTLIWAADMKQLYRVVNLSGLHDPKLRTRVEDRRDALKDLRGGDSVFTVFLTLDTNKEYFTDICSGHFFYTPDTRGLSSLADDPLREFLAAPLEQASDLGLKKRLMGYISDYFRLNTFEIAIPVLRDPALAPEGKVGMVVSLLFDYCLTRKIDEFGWGSEMRIWMERCSVDVLNDSIFKGLRSMVSGSFSSSPLTIEKMTGNTDAASQDGPLPMPTCLQ